MMSQGTNNTYAAPHAHGQDNVRPKNFFFTSCSLSTGIPTSVLKLILMDQYMANAQSWATRYAHYPQNLEPTQWMAMPEQTRPAYPVRVVEGSSSYKPRPGKHCCTECGSTFPTPSALSVSPIDGIPVRLLYSTPFGTKDSFSYSYRRKA